MASLDGSRKEHKNPSFKVGVTLTKAQHQRFKMQCAAKGDKMQTVLMRAVEEYCKTLARPPLSKEQKAEDRRVRSITNSLTARAADFLKPGERLTATELFHRIKAASTDDTKPSLADIVFLKKERLKNMLNQKSGTGRGFKPNKDDLTFELSTPAAGAESKAKTPRRRTRGGG